MIRLVEDEEDGRSVFFFTALGVRPYISQIATDERYRGPEAKRGFNEPRRYDFHGHGNRGDTRHALPMITTARPADRQKI